VVSFGEANAATEEEKSRVYDEGRDKADFVKCGFYADDDAVNRQPPNPDSAVKRELELFPNPYIDYSDRQYEQAWTMGFTDICYKYYMEAYIGDLEQIGASDAEKAKKECESAGYDAAIAGEPREPAKFSIQMSHSQKFYHVLPASDQKNNYEAGWLTKCSEFYNQGFYKVESDEALAREAGELFGIDEEEVVEFFGGEEGVEQAYRENCVIATASYGSPMAKEVQMLREIRDNQLLKTESGSAFMSGFNTVYYSFAPTIAQWEQENPAFKQVVKTTITPLITSLSLLNHVSMDSEAEVLGYGISLILLNIGMYFVAPATVVWQVKKRI